MDRLSVLDAEFLHLEDGIAHMHIAGISVFEPPAPTAADLASLLASKLHLIPRYRQRVRTVPFELGRPVWVDDPHFNLDYHVRGTALPHPADDAALCRLMGRLMSQPLDRDRPLWESWLVEGLPDDRWALINKVHHCMVDGISGVDLLSVLLDLEPEVQLPTPPAWRPSPEPSGPAKIVDAWLGLASDSVALIGRLPAVLNDPIAAVTSIGTTGEGLVRMGRHLGSTPPLSIEGTIGPHRVWAHSSASLDDVRRIRKEFGGTINDVVLAVVTNGYRELLRSRHEDPAIAVVRTLVPVSLRTETARGTFDNRVSAILYELPVGIADPVERLWSVEHQMNELKASHMPEAGDLVTTVGNLAPPMVIGTLSRLATRLTHQLPQRSINTVTTNVPGPQFPLYCMGRRMLEYRPFVPISHGVRVGTAILSYDGNLAFGVTGDYDTAPDVDVLARGITAGVDALLARAGAG
jgi:diacylglycerol O-acyltransferase